MNCNMNHQKVSAGKVHEYTYFKGYLNIIHFSYMHTFVTCPDVYIERKFGSLTLNI